MSLDPRHHDFQDTPGGMPRCVQCGVFYGKHDSIDCPCPPSHVAELTRLRSLLDGLVKAVEPFADFQWEIAVEAVDGDPKEPVFSIENTKGQVLCAITADDFVSVREAYLKAKGV